MFEDDKNIVDAIYRDESWIDPKTMPGAADNQFKHVKKVMLECLFKEMDKSGKIIIEEMDSYYYKQYITEYKASIAILSVDEYKRLKRIEGEYEAYLESES